MWTWSPACCRPKRTPAHHQQLQPGGAGGAGHALDTQHTVFGESFVILGFGADSDAMLQDVVATEQPKSGSILEGERDTYLHRIAFQMLAAASLDPVASKALILETAESLWSGAGRQAHA